MSHIIPVDGVTPESIKQVYERNDLNKQMYAFLLNNCKNLVGERFRITRLKLKISVNLEVPGSLQVINIKRKSGDNISMYCLHEQDGEALYGVENEDLNFETNVSRSSEKRVVCDMNLQPGATAETLSFETQTFHDYGGEGLPKFMLFVMIKTPTSREGIKYLNVSRKMVE